METGTWLFLTPKLMLVNPSLLLSLNLSSMGTSFILE